MTLCMSYSKYTKISCLFRFINSIILWVSLYNWYVMILGNSSRAHDLDTHGLCGSNFDTRQEHRMADSHFQVSCNGPPEAEIGCWKLGWRKKLIVFWPTGDKTRKSSLIWFIYYFMILAGPGAGGLDIYSRWSHMFQRFPPIDVGDLCVEKRLGTAMVAGVSIATTWWGSADPWSVPCLWWQVLNEEIKQVLRLKDDIMWAKIEGWFQGWLTL